MTGPTGPRIELRQGDCRRVLPTLAAESVHMVATDPPYFLDGLDEKWTKADQTQRPTRRQVVGGLPSGMAFDPGQGRRLQTFIHEVGHALLRTLKPGGFALVCSQARLAHRMATGLEDAGFELRDAYAWHYTKQAQAKAFGMRHLLSRARVSEDERERLATELTGLKTAQLRPAFETVLLAQKRRAGTIIENWRAHRTGLMNASVRIDGRTPTTVMRFEKERRGRDAENPHPTVKPVALMAHLIRLFSRPGQTVLDPFLGSGTTAVAAHRTGRACIGIELRRDYLTIAEARIGREQQRLELEEDKR